MHERFAEWLGKDRQVNTVDVNLTLPEIANFRMYRPVSVHNRRFLVKSMRFTFDSSSDYVSCEGTKTFVVESHAMIAGDSSFRLRFARNDMGYWGTYRLRFLTCVRNGKGYGRECAESVLFFHSGRSYFCRKTTRWNLKAIIIRFLQRTWGTFP